MILYSYVDNNPINSFDLLGLQGNGERRNRNAAGNAKQKKATRAERNRNGRLQFRDMSNGRYASKENYSRQFDHNPFQDIDGNKKKPWWCKWRPNRIPGFGLVDVWDKANTSLNDGMPATTGATAAYYTQKAREALLDGDLEGYEQHARKAREASRVTSKLVDEISGE